MWWKFQPFYIVSLEIIFTSQSRVIKRQSNEIMKHLFIVECIVKATNCNKDSVLWNNGRLSCKTRWKQQVWEVWNFFERIFVGNFHVAYESTVISTMRNVRKNERQKNIKIQMKRSKWGWVLEMKSWTGFNF